VATVGLLVGGVAALDVVSAVPARAIGSWNNANLATDALADVGQDPAPGGGQCKAFLDAKLTEASGGTQSFSGYLPADYESGGGVEVSAADATEGDVIQITPAGATTDAKAVALEEDNPDNSADRLHTTIIVSNNGDGNFTLVDANFTAPNTVGTHTLNPYTSSWDVGSTVNIYQMGTVVGDPSPSSGWAGVGSSQYVGSYQLLSGQEMGAGEYLVSDDVQFALVFQTDGNLVLYHGSGAIWSSGTGGSGANLLVMQGDGNLVLYNGSTPVWDSGTGGDGSSYTIVQSDGNFVVYSNTTGQVTWNSGTEGDI